jgi:hypothetical protein
MPPACGKTHFMKEVSVVDRLRLATPDRTSLVSAGLPSTRVATRLSNDANRSSTSLRRSVLRITDEDASLSRSMCVWDDRRYRGIATLVALSSEIPK